MRINKVEDTIEECEKHLKETDSYNTPIEAYLTRYLLVLISASFEEYIEKIFIERGSKSADVFVTEYFKSEMPNKLKSVGITKISEFLKKFGSNYRRKFQDEVSVTIEATLYSNIISNRHKVAHETEVPSMTFREVVDAYRRCNCILDKITDILNDEE